MLWTWFKDISGLLHWYQTALESVHLLHYEWKQGCKCGRGRIVPAGRPVGSAGRADGKQVFGDERGYGLGSVSAGPPWWSPAGQMDWGHLLLLRHRTGTRSWLLKGWIGREKKEKGDEWMFRQNSKWLLSQRKQSLNCILCVSIFAAKHTKNTFFVLCERKFVRGHIWRTTYSADVLWQATINQIYFYASVPRYWFVCGHHPVIISIFFLFLLVNSFFIAERIDHR